MSRSVSACVSQGEALCCTQVTRARVVGCPVTGQFQGCQASCAVLARHGYSGGPVVVQVKSAGAKNRGRSFRPVSPNETAIYLFIN